MEKYYVIPNRISESIHEIFHLSECKNGELQSENRIDIEGESHFNFDCDVTKECSVWPNIAAQTLYIIPFFGESTGLVRFTIIQNDKAVSVYEYQSRLFIAAWFLFLPFTWVNLFGGSFENHFATSNVKAVNEFKKELDATGIRSIRGN
ncbi:hypothetical protein V6Z05_00420 [Leptospira venezuelensis]|uniref:hypothetical protein n=1 Tax=Leptospira venezuelensis TaxID=1958811 RepID=UPI000A387770|nr:hypothetical protein [Leptospira venezuelensis]